MLRTALRVRRSARTKRRHAPRRSSGWNYSTYHEYEAAYELEPARLRVGGAVRQFVRSMKARRAPFGRVISRKFVGAAYPQKLSGAPDSDYEGVLFKTSFQHKALAAERLILTAHRGRWHEVDYRLY